MKKMKADRYIDPLQEILLRRKNMVIVPEVLAHTQTEKEKALLTACMKNINSLGYSFSKELMEWLVNLHYDEIEYFYFSLLPMLKKLRGAEVSYTPMYPNFPQQVAEASDAELFVNAVIHYISMGSWTPEYEKAPRLPLLDDDKTVILTVGSHADLMAVFSNLVGSKTSLSQQDKEDVIEIIKECPDFGNYLPNEIFLKENVAFVCKAILDNAPVKDAAVVSKYFKTATDVLRLIVALSDGDISLANPTKYRSLRRAERRMVMDLLAGCGNILEDLYRYPNEWLHAIHSAHPFEFCQKKYAGVNQAFNTLRNEKKPLLFAGKVDALIKAGRMEEAARMLESRPGDFARQLDKLLRGAKDERGILNSFAKVAEKVSSPVLLQLREHFTYRNEDLSSPRIFFPKGNLAKVKMIENHLGTLSPDAINMVRNICTSALAAQYREREPLGNVYIDPELEHYIVPFSQRSASKAVKTIVRGSRIPIDDTTKVVRAFIWWTNTDNEQFDPFWGIDGESRVDIDISASVYDENMGYLGHVSWTNLRLGNKISGLYHSGDLTDGGPVNGKGVAEFIDIDIQSVLDMGGRYFIFTVHSYTEQKFKELPNCRFGWMEREDVNSGEIFEPSTVEMKMDLMSDSVTAIPVIFDCQTRQFIWCDMSAPNSMPTGRGNTIEGNLKGVTATCYAIMHMHKPSIFDLAFLNAVSRGKLVLDRNQADLIFSNDKTPPVEIVKVEDPETGEMKAVEREKTEVPIITAFDTDYIMGQLL